MAILPLTRWVRLDATCLVIGSMAPDFEYFARMKEVSTISHTWLGLLVWNLPVTLLLAFAFHRLVKDALVLLAPRWIARRAAGLARRPWAEPWTIQFAITCAISALIGAVTHLLWDGVTHSDGIIASRVAALRAIVDVPILGRMALHRALQHISGLVGITVIAIWVWRALRRIEPLELPDPPRAWSRVIAAACLVGGLALAMLQLYRRPWLIDDWGSVAVMVISGGLAATLVTSALVWNAAKQLRG